MRFVLPAAALLLLSVVPPLAHAQSGPPRMNLQQRFATANVTRDGCLTQQQAFAGGIKWLAKNFQMVDNMGRGCVTWPQVKAASIQRRMMRQQMMMQGGNGNMPPDMQNGPPPNYHGGGQQQGGPPPNYQGGGQQQGGPPPNYQGGGQPGGPPPNYQGGPNGPGGPGDDDE